MIAYQSEIHQQRIEERTKAVEALEAQRRTTEQENSELDEVTSRVVPQRSLLACSQDIFALESSVVERQRLCELQVRDGVAREHSDKQQGSTAVSGGAAKAKKSALKMSLMVTHRRLLDLAKAQTREIELMREELVRLRARTFPSFAQLADNGRTMTGTLGSHLRVSLPRHITSMLYSSCSTRISQLEVHLSLPSQTELAPFTQEVSVQSV
eukprot:757218-Hanusia_phi.AAC.1